MVRLIPGYEYYIFISYRQKNNKGDCGERIFGQSSFKKLI